MIGQDFERNIVHSFNNYANTYDKKLIAYRHVQMRYQPQLFDVLVDSRANEFYLAIECKSIDPSTINHLYFKRQFSWKDGHCQLEREDKWLRLSGRNGILAVELRPPRPARTRLYLVPWSVVMAQFNAGYTCVDQELICACPSCDRQGGKYIFDDDLLGQVIERLGSYPKSTRKAYRPKPRPKKVK